MPNVCRTTFRRTAAFGLATCVTVSLIGALPSIALASHTQTTFFEAPRELFKVTPAARTKTFAQLQALGVHALRVELAWHDVAPNSNGRQEPSFDATNPGSYDWGEYDAVIDEASRLGWQVLLTVTSPVPLWATAGHKDLVTNPDDRAFEEFMTAVGRHYGNVVSLFAIWNEPNHPAFLLPQFSRNGQPASPHVYRGLFQAGYAGLRAAGLSDPKVLMGETAPIGYDTVNIHLEGRRALTHDVAPLAFLRGALCLDAHYRKAATCESLAAYGYGAHPYTVGTPFYQPKGRDDVTIGVLNRLSSALDKAVAAHALSRHIPIFITEFGIQSTPSILGVSLQKQAEYDAMAEKIAYDNPRVASFSQYLLRDDPLGGAPGASVHGGRIGFQTGLETVKGKFKPLYSAFPVPLVVSKSGHRFSLWGLVRPAGGPTVVQVLALTRSVHHYRVLATVHTNSSGYWTLHTSTPGVKWRVRWRSPSGHVDTGPGIA